MPRCELLTPTKRVHLFTFPKYEGELIGLAILAKADLTYIRQHRGDNYRLSSWLSQWFTCTRNPAN
jgi:hypothetical protein